MTLSGSEAQRAVVARALVGGPELVLADEPTGQLDRTNTLQVIDALVAARPLHTTVVIATHDPLVAEACDRTIRFDQGRLVDTP